MSRLISNAGLAAILALPWPGAGAAYGQGGTLPKGDEATDDGVTGKAQSKGETKRPDCILDLTEPPGGNGHFAADGKTLLLLAQAGAAGDGKGKKKKAAAVSDSARIRYTLIEINLNTRRGKPVLALEHRQNASLIVTGEPAVAVAAVSFAGKEGICYQGPAGVTSVALDLKSAKPVQASGTFQLVEAPNGRILADMKKGMILRFDPGTFQTKIARKFTVGERPLFVDAPTGPLVTWVNDGKNRGLIAYPPEKKKGADGAAAPDGGKGGGKAADKNAGAGIKRLGFKPNERVLQQGGRFAAARFDNAANTIEIIEMPGWTKSDGGTFKVKVPPQYPIAGAAIDVNFEHHLAVLYGGTFTAKQKWQRALVFDYEAGKLLGSLATSGSQYLGFTGVDPTGAFAVAEIRDISSRRTTGAKLFNVADRSVADISLNLPADDALATSAKDKKKEKKPAEGEDD